MELENGNNDEEKKKRSLEEALEPVLIRIPSDDPSCSSDFIHIHKDQFKIGRKPDNDEVILSVWISRNHCIIQQDKENGNWLVTNLSSTDTLLNDKSIARNETEILKDGDILQLSLSDCFKYKFALIEKEHQCLKYPRLQSSNCELGTVLNQQKSFVKCHENERKDLEKQLTSQQRELEQLRQELDKLLDQKNLKISNEELNNEIIQLQNKIEGSKSTELELQQKYKDLLGKLEEERLKFEEKFAQEKQKYQETLREAKQEKEKMEMTMIEQMEKLEKTQHEEWQKKIDHLLQEEKSVQTKLQEEKLLLEQKLKEMEQTLKNKEEAQQQSTLVAISHAIDMQNCIVLEVTERQNLNGLPILETIDLTGTNECTTSTVKACQNEAVIDKVNHIMDEQLTCSICSELFVRAMTLNCTHTFCRHCIDSWIKRRRDCPNCRTNIVSMTRSLVVDNFIEKMLESLTPEQMQKRKQLIEERKMLSNIHVKKKIVKRK